MKCQKVTRTTKTCNSQCGQANKKGRKPRAQPGGVRMCSAHAGTVEKEGQRQMEKGNL